MTATGGTDLLFPDALRLVSSDRHATVSAGPLANGQQTFTVTLTTAGRQTIAVIDQARGTIKGPPVLIQVSPGAPELSVAGFPLSVLAGTRHRFSVTAQDSYGNRVANFTDTVSVAGATYTFQPGDHGRHVFTTALPTPGTASITAADQTRPGVPAGTEADIAVIDHVTALVSPPAFDLPGQPTGVPGQPLTFTLSATRGGIPADTVFTYRIDWNGDGKGVTLVSGPSGQAASHVYAAQPPAKMRVTVLDAAGEVVGQAAEQVTLGAVALEADPADGARTALVIGAPAGGGTVLIAPTSADGAAVSVAINGVPQPLPSPLPALAHILVYGQGGNLVVREVTATINSQTATVAVPAIILGGRGTNTLSAAGSSAGNVLVGGPGKDSLTGGGGDDVLIGGAGADALQAGGGGDVLIAGGTAYDANLTALLALMAEWGRGGGAGYQQRVEDLYGTGTGGLNGGYVLNGQTVLRDAASDWLLGGGGKDWFWLVARAKSADLLSGYTDGEVVTFE
jgi:hypothetical protein